MKLLILNKELEVLDIIDEFQTLMWNTRFRGLGSFQLNLNSSDKKQYLQEDNIVYCSDEEEGGIIQHFNCKGTNKKQLEIKGYLTTGYLDRRINWGIVNYSGSAEVLMRELVNDNCINPSDSNRKIPLLELGELKGFTETINIQDSYSNLADLLTKICETTGLGYHIRLDLKNKKLIFEVLKGEDRTINQTAVEPTIFSSDYENILDEEYTLDSGEYKNTALIAGCGEGADRKTSSIGTENKGLDRREIYVDARDLQNTKQDGDKQVDIPDSEYIELLYQRGNEKVGEYKKIETFEATVDTNANNVYGVNYAEGTKVTFVEKDLNKILNTDIPEIQKTYEKGVRKIVPKFGSKIPTRMVI